MSKPSEELITILHMMMPDELLTVAFLVDAIREQKINAAKVEGADKYISELQTKIHSYYRTTPQEGDII